MSRGKHQKRLSRSSCHPKNEETLLFQRRLSLKIIRHPLHRRRKMSKCNGQHLRLITMIRMNMNDPLHYSKLYLNSFQEKNLNSQYPMMYTQLVCGTLFENCILIFFDFCFLARTFNIQKTTSNSKYLWSSLAEKQQWKHFRLMLFHEYWMYEWDIHTFRCKNKLSFWFKYMLNRFAINTLEEKLARSIYEYFFLNCSLNRIHWNNFLTNDCWSQSESDVRNTLNCLFSYSNALFSGIITFRRYCRFSK